MKKVVCFIFVLISLLLSMTSNAQTIITSKSIGVMLYDVNSKKTEIASMKIKKYYKGETNKCFCFLIEHNIRPQHSDWITYYIGKGQPCVMHQDYEVMNKYYVNLMIDENKGETKRVIFQRVKQEGNKSLIILTAEKKAVYMIDAGEEGYKYFVDFLSEPY